MNRKADDELERVLREAPYDDEGETPDEAERARIGREQIARGETVPLEKLRRKRK